MKKGIYLNIITIITVICIIGGSLYHLVNFLSFLPFHTTTSGSSTKEVASSASEPLDAFQNIMAAAALAKGTTIIENAAKEPDLQKPQTERSHLRPD